MSAVFKVGDRVQVNYPQWRGEGVVELVPRPGEARQYISVEMKTGKMAGQRGGFEAKDLEHAGFKSGDRVRYAGNREGMYVNKRNIGRVGEFIRYTSDRVCADIRYDNDSHTCNVYACNLESATQPEPVVPQPGDRVKVTIVGDVRERGGYTVVVPDGATDRDRNHINHNAEGVTVEVIEPEYPTGTVVKDARGVYYQREHDGWLRFGITDRLPHVNPIRPLTAVS